MAYAKKTWVDDDGSLTVGTLFSAANMNNIEAGISGLIELLEKAGMGVVVHGSTKATARPTGFDIVVWIGTVEPEHGAENDLWVNPEDFGLGSQLFAPSARVYKSTSLAVLTGTITAVPFDSERWDIGGLHSTVTNTSRLTAPKAGVYTVSAHVGWEAEITNPTFLAIRVNGTSVYAAQWTVASFQTEQSTHTEVKLEAGDYVEMLVYQNQGKTVGTAGAGKSNYQVGLEFTMTWLGTGTAAFAPVDWGIVTELPSAANEGDTCRLKVRESGSASWKIWECVKLEASGERPWAKIGGPPLLSSVAASKTTASETVQTSGAPSITSPANIEAIFRFGANRLLTPGTGFGLVTLELAGVGTGVQALGGGVGIQMPLGGIAPGVLASGAAAVAGYSKIAGTGEANFLGLYLEIDPVRLG